MRFSSDRQFRATLLAAAGLLTVAPGWAADPAKAQRKLQQDGHELTVAAFFTQVFMGNTRVVRLYLDAGTEADAVDAKGRRPLHVAARSDDEKMLALLLGAGASVDVRTPQQDTPLCNAAEDARTRNVKLLVDAHADVNLVCSQGHTALYRAAEKGDAAAVALLLAAHADPNTRDPRGETALHAAAGHSAEAVLALLRAGADASARANNGATPLSVAREAGNAAAIAQLEQAKPGAAATVAPTGDPLVELKKMGIVTLDGKTLFQRLEANDVRAVTLLLAAGIKTSVRNGVGQPPLSVAIEKGELPMVEALLSAGADPADHGKHVRPELESNSDNVMLAVERGDAAILRALLATGVSPNHPNDNGATALAAAATSRRPDLMRMLIAAKADVNFADSKYHVPVIAAAVAQGDAETVKVLIEAGAKVAPYRKMLLETRDDPEIRALIVKASGGGPVPAAVAPKPRVAPAAQPAAKGLLTAQQAYALLLPRARSWQEDAEVTTLTTTTEGLLQDDGRSAHWVIDFVSRSALQANLMRVDEGRVSSTLQPATGEPMLRIRPTTILDTRRLNEIADAAGAREYAARATRPMAGLQTNSNRALWYFNYEDKETRGNLLTIVIDAETGAIVLKDGK